MTVHINENGKRSTFIHIPKNAGTAISNWIWKIKGKHTEYKSRAQQKKLGGKHARQHQIAKHLGDLGYTFLCVRNPWDRLLSSYHYATKNIASFEEFVLRVKDKPDLIDFWGCSSTQQVDYYQENKVDYIIRYETLEEDFKVIQDFYGDQRKLGRTNESANQHIRDYRPEFTTEMVDLVYELCADDIKRFNYSFE